MQRDLQAPRRQVFLNNTSCLKARSAAPRVWQTSYVGDLVPQATGGRPLIHPIPEQVNMAEMTIPLWRQAGLFRQRQMKAVRRDGSSQFCETGEGDVGCAAGSTSCQGECSEQPNSKWQLCQRRRRSSPGHREGAENKSSWHECRKWKSTAKAWTLSFHILIGCEKTKQKVYF